MFDANDEPTPLLSAAAAQQEGRTPSPLEAVRAECLSCSNGSVQEVRLCHSTRCALWPLRFGQRLPNAPRSIVGAIRAKCLDCSGDSFALRLAMLVEPKREWRIITSSKNSTVWDGCVTLFEFNWQAFGVPADVCFRSAHDEVLRPGEFMVAGFPEPEVKRRLRKRKAATAA
jgi:hypothetical protein